MAHAQAVKEKVEAGAPEPELTYHGLVPGRDSAARVREVLGEPALESRFYNHKLYYPSAAASGGGAPLYDVVHLIGGDPSSDLANIDAVSVPEGLETTQAIRERLGEPEYELVMKTFRLLDYSERGLRFTVDEGDHTTGVAYIPHGFRRVPAGERRVVDLSELPDEPTVRKTAGDIVLDVGVATVDVSPKEPDWLNHPFEIIDPIEARIVLLRSYREGEIDSTVALVGIDLFGMGLQDVRPIRTGLSELDVEVLFAMSHNHAAPDTIGVYGHYPVEYIEFIQSQVRDGIERAFERLHPVSELRVASTELPMHGARVHGLFRNARNPGVLDPTVSLIQIVNAADEPSVVATLVNFACHVESLEAGARQISADFPGVMARTLEASGAGTTLFLNGAVGGMVSGDNESRTFDSARTMGLRLAQIVDELAESAQPTRHLELEVARRNVEIPVSNKDFLPLYDRLRPLHRGRVETEMLLVRLGGAEIVSLPGELLPEVSFEILERMTGYPRLLVGLANDQLGYLIPPYDFRAGYYEESMSQGPAAALIVRDTAIRLLRGID